MVGRKNPAADMWIVTQQLFILRRHSHYMKVDGARWAWEKETSVSYILQQQTATYTLLLQIVKQTQEN